MFVWLVRCSCVGRVASLCVHLIVGLLVCVLGFVFAGFGSRLWVRLLSRVKVGLFVRAVVCVCVACVFVGVFVHAFASLSFVCSFVRSSVRSCVWLFRWLV